MLTNQILHGDCYEILPTLPDQSVDMILTDPPYGITQNQWDIAIPLQDLWKQYERIIKNDGAIIFTSSEPFTSLLIMSNRDLFKYDLIWEKSIATGFLNANRMPLRGHENILVFYKKLPTFHPQKFMLTTPSFKKANIKRPSNSTNYGKFDIGNSSGSEDGSRFPRSVFSIKYDAEFFNSTKSGLMVHPTQKPVALFEYLIKTYSNEGDLVLDSFSGSGTTAVACQRLNRRFLCIEKEQEYYEHSLERLRGDVYQPDLNFDLC